MKVILDSACSFKYASLYIQGFIDYLGKTNVEFQSKPFMNLKAERRRAFDQYLACRIIDNRFYKNIIIDYRDNGTIDMNAYEWSDLYCKINYSAHEATDLDKVFKIAPNFAIRIYSLLPTIFHASINYINCFKQINSDIKKLWWGGYLRSYQRPSISDYEKEVETLPDYIFSVSTLWKHENCLNGTNPNRAIFFRTCKAKNTLKFEGGFYLPGNIHPQGELFKDIIINEPVSQDEYLKKTKQSAFVFNTPAVFNCHGWKLGEYMAMGKAIISTPLYYELPEPLVHGQNIHFIQSMEDINEAIDLLLNDKEYKMKLEKGASEYYNKYIKPCSAIKRIIDRLQL